MPQYQQLKKGQSRIRVLSKDATRAYLLLMKHCGGRLTSLPNDIYVVEERILPILEENLIDFELLDRKQ